MRITSLTAVFPFVLSAAGDLAFKVGYSQGSKLVGFFKVSGATDDKMRKASVDFDSDESQIFTDKFPTVFDPQDDLSFHSELLIDFLPGKFCSKIGFNLLQHEERARTFVTEGVDAVVGLGPNSDLAKLFPRMELMTEKSGEFLMTISAAQEKQRYPNVISLKTLSVGAARFGLMGISRFEFLGNVKEMDPTGSPSVIFDPSFDTLLIPKAWVVAMGQMPCDSKHGFLSLLHIEDEGRSRNIIIPSGLMGQPADTVSASKRKKVCSIRAMLWDGNVLVIGRQVLAAMQRVVIDHKTGVLDFVLPENTVKYTPLPNTLPERIVRAPKLESHRLTIEKSDVSFNSFILTSYTASQSRGRELINVDPRFIMARKLGLITPSLLNREIDVGSAPFSDGTWEDAENGSVMQLNPQGAYKVTFLEKHHGFKIYTQLNNLIGVKRKSGDDALLSTVS